MGDELPSAVVSTTRTVENSKIDSADVDKNRDHSEDCTKSGDELTSTVVDTMRKVEISKFDSAYKTRDHTEDRSELGDDLPSTVVYKMRKVENSKIDSADADETRINATSADVELPLKVIKLGPFFAAEGLQMPRAVQPCFLSPELLFASVPAAPNISYQRSLPTTVHGVKCALTAGPNAIACMCVNIISPQHIASCRQSIQGDVSCRYIPIAVGRLIDAPQRLPPEKTFPGLRRRR